MQVNWQGERKFLMLGELTLMFREEERREMVMTFTPQAPLEPRGIVSLVSMESDSGSNRVYSNLCNP